MLQLFPHTAQRQCSSSPEYVGDGTGVRGCVDWGDGQVVMTSCLPARSLSLLVRLDYVEPALRFDQSGSLDVSP